MLYFRLTFLFSSSCFLDILGIMFPVSGLRCAVLLPLYRMRQFPLKVAHAHAYIHAHVGRHNAKKSGQLHITLSFRFDFIKQNQKVTSQKVEKSKVASFHILSLSLSLSLSLY